MGLVVILATPYIGPVTVYGPWRDRVEAETWARDNVFGSWVVHPVLEALAA